MPYLPLVYWQLLARCRCRYGYVMALRLRAVVCYAIVYRH